MKHTPGNAQLFTSIAVIALSVQFSFAQTFLNGDFEINTAGFNRINQSNVAYNGFMSNTTAFGPGGNMDIVTTGVYCGLPQNGAWYTALTGIANDAITMQLSVPLVAGNSYTIEFWDKACVAFSCGPLPLQIGLSTVNNAIGTIVYTAPVSIDAVWTQRNFTFVAPNNGQYISVTLIAGTGCNWVQVDNFSFVVVVPIELLQFTGKVSGDVNLLEWTTATESRNSIFTIERSMDATDWEVLGEVPGVEYSSLPMDYAFIDSLPHSPVGYYRIRQTDLDGAFEYSSIVAVNRSTEELIEVYPNPSTGIFTVTGTQTVQVFDMLGNLVLATPNREIDLSSYPAGIYFVKTGEAVRKLILN